MEITVLGFSHLQKVNQSLLVFRLCLRVHKQCYYRFTKEFWGNTSPKVEC